MEFYDIPYSDFVDDKSTVTRDELAEVLRPTSRLPCSSKAADSRFCSRPSFVTFAANPFAGCGVS